jgi:CRP-like cAMP-binding protein
MFEERRKITLKPAVAQVTGSLRPTVARESVQFAKSAKLFPQGKPVDTVFFVESGTVKITV